MIIQLEIPTKGKDSILTATSLRYLIACPKPFQSSLKKALCLNIDKCNRKIQLGIALDRCGLISGTLRLLPLYFYRAYLPLVCISMASTSSLLRSSAAAVAFLTYETTPTLIQPDVINPTLSKSNKGWKIYEFNVAHVQRNKEGEVKKLAEWKGTELTYFIIWANREAPATAITAFSYNTTLQTSSGFEY